MFCVVVPVYLKIDLSCGKHCTVSPGEDSDGVVVVVVDV